MAVSKTRDIHSKDVFVGALRMQLGSEGGVGYGRSGSFLSSTLPPLAIPMADSRDRGKRADNNINTPGQNKRPTGLNSASPSRRGSPDGSPRPKTQRNRKDVTFENSGARDGESSSQGSRTSSFTERVWAQGQALSGALHRVLGSQIETEYCEPEVRYPNLPALGRDMKPMPGAFPESPHKRVTAIEAPQPTAIGPDNGTPKPIGMVLESRGGGSSSSGLSRHSPLASVSPSRKSHGIGGEERSKTPKPHGILDRATRHFAVINKPTASTSTLSGDVIVSLGETTSTSNEQTPVARLRAIPPGDTYPPAPPNSVIVGPTGSDTEYETDISTRPVSPEPIHNVRQGSLPRFPATEATPPPIAFNHKGIGNDLQERFPFIIAHAPAHQRLWDRLAVGTLFTVARASNELGIDLESLDGKELERLLGRNITMRRVEEILRSARREDWVQVEDPDKAAERELEQVAAELDWEAEQICQGTGEMLGWKEEKGTRYGGKVQFSATLKLDERTMASMKNGRSDSTPPELTHCARVTLEPPSLRGSSLFARTFGSHHFLRVRVSKTIQIGYGPWSTNRERARKDFQEWARRPIFILGRVYAPLIEKDGVLVYFLEGIEHVGEVFDRGRVGYGLTECATIRQFLDWWIPLRHNGGQDVAKLFTRLDLGISDTIPGMLILPQNIHVANDIVNENGIEFTDGAGLMTPSISKAIHDRYGEGPSSQLHMAYQIRIHTAKGVILADPVMITKQDYEGPHRLKLYRSMCKSSRGSVTLRKGPVNGFHILDAACCILCIVKPAPTSSASGARLSSQFTTILSGGGVPSEVFMRLQSEALRRELVTWTDVKTEEYKDESGKSVGRRVDETTRLRLARVIGRSKGAHLMIKKRELGGMAKGLGYARGRKADRAEDVEEDEEIGESSEDEAHPTTLAAVGSFESLASVGTVSGKVKRASDPWATNDISGLPVMKWQQLELALEAGIDVAKSNYFYNIWVDLAKTEMYGFVSKFHLPIQRSASGFFQPDPTGTLNEGEVCYMVKEDMTDPESAVRVRWVLGDVIVGRHPALLPTDMRKVRAVEVPILQNHAAILFFSVKGQLPLASICAGGDYDGDDGVIIWEPEIVTPFRNADINLRNPPEGFEERFERTGTKTRVVENELRNLPEPEYSIQLAKYLMASVGEGNIFKIYNAYWNMAVYRDGLCGYRNGDGKTVSTATAAIMGHTFNFLMDSKKTGVRIKSSVLEKDKQQWGMFEEPFWRQKQLDSDAKSFGAFTRKPKILRPLSGEKNILDRLVHSGEADMNKAIGELKRRLRPEDRGSGDLYFDGNGTDADLTRPWFQAQEWVRGSLQRVMQLSEIEEGIRRCQEEFRQLNVDTAKSTTTMAQRRTQLREICKRFASLRPERAGDDGGIMDHPAGEDWLRLVKASCAYVCDAVGRGGRENGFAWHMAMRDLCEIKARAVSSGNTVTTSYSVYERKEVHRYWGQLD